MTKEIMGLHRNACFSHKHARFSGQYLPNKNALTHTLFIKNKTKVRVIR